jgi:hypothetical protein
MMGPRTPWQRGGGSVAESPSFNQVYYTSAPPQAVVQYLSMIRAPGWTAQQIGPWTFAWSHRYMTNAVLIVGVLLLITTLIGGLLLLARSTESLMGNVMTEGGRTKVIFSGSADQYMAGAIFNAMNNLPTG